MMYYIVSGLFLLFCWCPCMAINVSVQYNGGLLPDIILLTQCYLHRGTRLNAMKRFCICSLSSHLNVLTFFPPNRGMPRRSRCALIFLLTPFGRKGRTTYSTRYIRRKSGNGTEKYSEKATSPKKKKRRKRRYWILIWRQQQHFPPCVGCSAGRSRCVQIFL